MLPTYYKLDDYESCKEQNGLYCKLEAVLKADNNKTVYNEIKIYDPFLFDRHIIHRILCVSNNKSVDDQVNEAISKELVDYNISAKIDYIFCKKDNSETDFINQFLLYFLTILVTIEIIATYCDIKQIFPSNALGSYLKHFSLKTSWNSRTNVSKNEDYTKLLSMQGVRSLTMFGVVFMHLALIYCMIFVKNHEEIEELAPPNVVSNSFLFIVLPFFVLSSWLLTVQVLRLVDKYGELSLRNVFVMILNRYFRLLSVSIFVIGLLIAFMDKIVGHTMFDLVMMHKKHCMKNWWFSVLFIQNSLFFKEMCSPVTWYLAADFHLFIANLFFLYVMLKYKLNWFKAFGTYFSLTFIFHIILLYHYGLIYKPTIRNSQIRHFVNSHHIKASYTSSLSNASCSVIGLILGAVYYKNKNKTFKFNRFVTKLWYFSFLILPVMAVWVDFVDYGLMKDVFLRPFTKAAYCFGIGIGILGMSHGMGGLLKKFYESKVLIFISNFTYSTYLIHFAAFVYFLSDSMVYLNIYRLVLNYIILLSVSIIGGIVITLIFEEPFYSLQKKLLPQIQTVKNKKL